MKIVSQFINVNASIYIPADKFKDKNQDVSRHHDENSVWDKSLEDLCSTLIHRNKEVSKYHDNSTVWEGNETRVNNENKTGNY